MAKNHREDTLLVRNIDVNCSAVTYDVLPGFHKEKDEDTGEVYQRFDNHAVEFSHEKYFAVRWGGQEFRIPPGKTRLMPRYVAEHYAKHLADHILAKREVALKKPGLVTSAIERPKVLQDILVEVVQRFVDEGIEDEGLKALQQVEEINQGVDLGNGEVAKAKGGARELHEVDGGQAVNPAVGVLTEEAKTVDEVLKEAGEAEGSPTAEPTRNELIHEAHALGISVAATDTKEILIAKIKNF